jgi:hypothetical protein
MISDVAERAERTHCPRDWLAAAIASGNHSQVIVTWLPASCPLLSLPTLAAHLSPLLPSLSPLASHQRSRLPPPPATPLQVAPCFAIELDKAATLVAAAGNRSASEDFFWANLVLSEGSVVACPAQPPTLQQQVRGCGKVLWRSALPPRKQGSTPTHTKCSCAQPNGPKT